MQLSAGGFSSRQSSLGGGLDSHSHKNSLGALGLGITRANLSVGSTLSSGAVLDEAAMRELDQVSFKPLKLSVNGAWQGSLICNDWLPLTARMSAYLLREKAASTAQGSEGMPLPWREIAAAGLCWMLAACCWSAHANSTRFAAETRVRGG